MFVHDIMSDGVNESTCMRGTEIVSPGKCGHTAEQMWSHCPCKCGHTVKANVVTLSRQMDLSWMSLTSGH